MYANFKDNNCKIFSFEVSHELDITSTAFDNLLENFCENENCDKGAFIDLTAEPRGETVMNTQEQRLYLVAREPITTAGPTYGAGTIFLVAGNDQAQGGYHARAILQADIAAEPAFDIVYEDGTLPYAADGGEHLFVPSFPVDEFTDEIAAVDAARKLDEESPHAWYFA